VTVVVVGWEGTGTFEGCTGFTGVDLGVLGEDFEEDLDGDFGTAPRGWRGSEVGEGMGVKGPPLA